jgi:flagellar protein FliL
MAKEADESPNDGERSAEAGAEAAPVGGGKRRLILIAAGALGLLIAIAAGTYFSGLLDGDIEAKQAEDVSAQPESVAFYVLPEILVSINAGERRSIFLKVKMSLEIADEGDKPRIDRMLPRIIDHCHVYLRELRPEELQGSAGSARLREELLRRISAAVAPVTVRDVLFNELFVQ